MVKKHDSPTAPFSLKDQQFLKELGISAMPSGVEFMLRQQQTASDRLSWLETKAEGLTSLALDEATLLRLSREKNIPIAELREKYQFFRDVENNNLPEDD